MANSAFSDSRWAASSIAFAWLISSWLLVRASASAKRNRALKRAIPNPIAKKKATPPNTIKAIVKSTSISFLCQFYSIKIIINIAFFDDMRKTKFSVRA